MIFETLTFSDKSSSCYGLEVVASHLREIGHTVHNYDINSKNQILVSVFWPEMIYDLIKLSCQSKGRQIIAGGNAVTTNPAVVLPFVDGAFVGDGEVWDGSLDAPNVASARGRVEIASAAEIKPMVYADVQSNKRSFCEISRGCKNKCLFCQYGWLKKYREADFERIKSVIECSDGKSIRTFAADRFQHSNYLKIRALLDKLGKCDTGSDLSLRFCLSNPSFLANTNKVRVGIEGCSFRLRKLVGKNYSDEDIVSFCKTVADAGIKCLDFYMIYGLPTETTDDVRDFFELIKKIDAVMPLGYTIAIHWNAFTPSAMTPLQYERAAFDMPADYLDPAMKRFPSQRCKFYHKPGMTGNKTILKRMLCIRGNEGAKKILFNVAKSPAKFLSNEPWLLKTFEQETGISLVEKIDRSKEMPWDKYVVYPKEKMLHLLDINLRKNSAPSANHSQG